MKQKKNFRKRPKKELQGLMVEVWDNNVEKAMRVLKKKLLKDGMMRELKERQYYQKPSHIKREAKKLAIRRLKKEHRLKELKDGF